MKFNLNLDCASYPCFDTQPATTRGRIVVARVRVSVCVRVCKHANTHTLSETYVLINKHVLKRFEFCSVTAAAAQNV